jgi:CO dehydrogenase maturation factor
VFIIGSFHCPIGAAAYGTAACIACGLCSAVTKVEFVDAARKMREYIRGLAAERAGLIRKIAVCGKGGTGKTTTSYLLARALVSFGFGVLVVDTDESNPSLHRLLGLGREPRALCELLPRGASDGNSAAKPSWLNKDKIAFTDIPEEYICRKGKFSLMVAGKIDEPLAGCACTIDVLARELMMNLAPKTDEFVVADLEAGVESFGRGLEQGVDTVIAVVEPSFDSVKVAASVHYMAQGLGISRIRAVLNKVPDRQTERALMNSLSREGIRYLGSLPADAEIARASLLGSPPEQSEAFEKMRVLTGLLLDEAEMDHP